MKRFLVLCGALFLCSAFVGCSSDTHEDLIRTTIDRIKIAAVNVGDIKTKVNDAVKKTEGGTKKLDLTEAVEATKTLKKTGEETAQLKRKIEQIRAQVTPDERKAYALSQKSSLNDAFKELVKQKEELRTALAEAEKLP